VDGRTDQFALAVIAYELLTGDRPFHADSLAGLFLKILREDPPALPMLNPGLNGRVDVAMKRALAKLPADRFATCGAFSKALTAALATGHGWRPLTRASAGSMATVVAPAPAPSAETVVAPIFSAEAAQPSRALWKVWAALGVLAALGFSAYLYVQRVKPVELAPPPVAQEQNEPGAAQARPSPLAAAPEPAVLPPPPPLTATKPPQAPTPAGPVSGIVEIASTPPGATVRIDQTRDQCNTPCSMELSQGRHVLHFTLDGHRKATLVITVPQETSASMRLDPLIGSLLVQTLPAGAKLLINGQPVADRVTPTTLRLAPGKYKLTLRLDGKRDHTQEVEVRDEAITHIEYNWP
jgi:serine/threonine-protein kinase